MPRLSVRESFFGLNSSFTSYQQLLLFFDSTIELSTQEIWVCSLAEVRKD